MILQSLANYYDTLAAHGGIARLGWAKAKVSYALNLSKTGELLSVLPLKICEQRGKKEVMVPQEFELPAPVKRTVNPASNYLWDNATYFLGLDEGNPERAKLCFQKAKELHNSLLNGLEDPFAEAICAFFEHWNAAEVHPLLSDVVEDLGKGANLTFMYSGAYAFENRELAKAWQRAYEVDEDDDEEHMRCLVSGQRVVPAKTHPSIKGVNGAQSSGAALVSFNAQAYESYNRLQNINAPVGKNAAFAYTSALNALLSSRNNDGSLSSCKLMGDTTVVYWAETAEPEYQSAFSAFFDVSDNSISTGDLNAVMQAVAHGKPIDWAGVPLNPDNKFYILGLAPNAARLSVRFFLQDTFGSFLRNLQEHYARLEIVKPAFDNFETIPLWKLFSETVNHNSRDKSPSPQMAGDTLRAILTGGMYPATLYQQVQLRIRAEREVSRGRAAIIKAYLLRNTNTEEYRGALTVELNADTTYQPYILGRLFSILEAIQEQANPGIQATIKDKYFTSACATPTVVFPLLLNLAQKHLRKIDGFYFEKQLGELVNLITESYPAHHTLYEQGIFQLGYYHQTQKRYEKKQKNLNLEEEQSNV